jgi:hypothetical protein
MACKGSGVRIPSPPLQQNSHGALGIVAILLYVLLRSSEGTRAELIYTFVVTTETLFKPVLVTHLIVT